MDLGPLVLGGNAPLADSSVFEQVRQKCHDKPKACRLQLGRSWTALLSTRVTPGGTNKNASNMHRMTFNQFAPLVVAWPALSGMALPSSCRKKDTPAMFSLPDHEAFASVSIFHSDYAAEPSLANTPENSTRGMLGSSISSVGSLTGNNKSTTSANHTLFPKYLQITTTLDLPASCPLKVFVGPLLNDLALCVVGNVTVLPPPTMTCGGSPSAVKKEPMDLQNSIVFVGMMVQRPPQPPTPAAVSSASSPPAGQPGKGSCSVQIQFLIGGAPTIGKTLAENIVRNNFPQEFHPFLTMASCMWKTLDGAVLGLLHAEQSTSTPPASTAKSGPSTKQQTPQSTSPKKQQPNDPAPSSSIDSSVALMSGELATQQLTKKRQEKSSSAAAAAVPQKASNGISGSSSSSDASGVAKKEATAPPAASSGACTVGGTTTRKQQTAGASSTVPTSGSSQKKNGTPADSATAVGGSREHILANSHKLQHQATELGKLSRTVASSFKSPSPAQVQHQQRIDAAFCAVQDHLQRLFQQPTSSCVASSISAAAQLGPDSKLLRQAIGSNNGQTMAEYLAFQETQLQQLLASYRKICRVAEVSDVWMSWSSESTGLLAEEEKQFTGLLEKWRSELQSHQAGKKLQPPATTTSSSSDLPSQDVSVGEVSPPGSVRKENKKKGQPSSQPLSGASGTAGPAGKKAPKTTTAKSDQNSPFEEQQDQPVAGGTEDAEKEIPQASSVISDPAPIARSKLSGKTSSSSKQQGTQLPNSSLTSNVSSASGSNHHSSAGGSSGAGGAAAKKRSLLQDNRFMNIMAFVTAAVLAVLVVAGFTLVE